MDAMSVRFLPTMPTFAPLCAVLLLLGHLFALSGCGTPPPPPPPAKSQASKLANLGDVKGAETARTELTSNFPAASLRRLQVLVDVGRIQLTTDLEATDIRISSVVELRAPKKELADAYLKEIAPDSQQDGDNLVYRIKTPQQWRNANFANRPGSMSVFMTITVPARMALDLQILNGPLLITGDLQEAQLKTVNGPITIDGVIRGRSGIDATNGTVTATIGDVESLSVSVSNGDARLLSAATRPLEGHFSMSVSNGSADIEFPAVSTGKITASVGNGSLKGTAPRNSSSTLILDCTNGTMDLIGEPSVMISRSESAIRAQLGDPLGEIRLSVLNGPLTLELVD